MLSDMPPNDRTVNFDPPLSLNELVHLANREDEAHAVLVLVLRFMVTVRKHRMAAAPVARTLELFRLARIRHVSGEYASCELTEAGALVLEELT